MANSLGMLRSDQADGDRRKGRKGKNCKVNAMEIGDHVDEYAVDFDNSPAELQVHHDKHLGGHAGPSEDQGSAT